MYVVYVNDQPQYYDGKLLCFSSTCTIFSTRKDAENAVRQTIEFAKKHKYPLWGIMSGYAIHKIETRVLK